MSCLSTTELPGRPIARSVLRTYQGAEFAAGFPCHRTAGEMRQILFSAIKVLISAALLYLALRKVNLFELASRVNNVASLGWIALAFAVCFLQIFIGVLRWCEVSAECHAPLPVRQAMRFNLIGTFFNQTLPSSIGGDAVRLWLVARAGAGWRAATYSIFVDRADRPDRACDHHRRNAAVELRIDRRPARPLGADAGRLRRTRRRPRFSGVRRAAMALAEALVGDTSHSRLRRHRQSGDFQPQARTESRGAVAARSRPHRRHRLVRRAVDHRARHLRPGLSAGTSGAADHHGADLDRRLGRARGDDGAGVRICRACCRNEGVNVSLVFGAVTFIVGAFGGLVWIFSAEKAARDRHRSRFPSRLPGHAAVSAQSPTQMPDREPSSSTHAAVRTALPTNERSSTQ